MNNMFRRVNWKPEFKQEWNWLETEGVMSYLQTKFKENYNIRDIEDKFGLPYTSTGIYAEISNTNCEFEIEPGIQLRYFAIHDNGNRPEYPLPIAVGWDDDENEYFYMIEED